MQIIDNGFNIEQFISLAIAGGGRPEFVRAVFEAAAARVSAYPQWNAGLSTVCTQVLSQVLVTEYDGKTPGNRGLGRLTTMPPRLAGEFRATASPLLCQQAAELSLRASKGSLLIGSLVLQEGALDEGAQIPNGQDLFREVVPELMAGATIVEEHAINGAEIAVLTYLLGSGAAHLIEAEAQRVGVKLFPLFGKGGARELFERVLIFHSTFGWTVHTIAVAMMRGKRVHSRPK